MLSTSYEAFYAMDNLRHRANITHAQMAEIIGVHDTQYRRIARRISLGDNGGLHGSVDLSIRRGIAFLIYGLLGDKLPLELGKEAGMVSHRRKMINDLAREFQPVWRKSQVGEDPTGFLKAKRESREQAIPTKVLLDHALQFTGWAT